METVPFKRNRFGTRLPTRYTYSLSHFWLDQEEESGLWRIGLTSFAARMLGEIVEFDFEVGKGARIEVADCIGWIEGFKATSDLYSPGRGEFEGVNEAALADASIICKDPYRRGWLYRIRGEPDERSVDVSGYIEHLELTIDKMLEKPWKSPEISSG